VRVVSLVLFAVCLTAGSPAAQRSSALGAPETFSAQAHAIDPLGAAAAPIMVVIQRYTPQAERSAVEAALATGGYPAFLAALRKSSDVGYVEHGTARFTIRYSRETKTDKGRRIDLVTDRPIYFVGGGAPDPKPRANFDVAVLHLEVDVIGFGNGVMAAAARLKPAPDGGVQIDDYAERPIKLVAVTRKLS
jgi:hypothetical protein